MRTGGSPPARIPGSEGDAAAVDVMRENQALTGWVSTVADEPAAAGYLAIAPDLLSGAAFHGGKTSDFAAADAGLEEALI